MAKMLVDAFRNDVVDPKSGSPLVAPDNYAIDAAIRHARAFGSLRAISEI
jgi:hypothetical protein